MVGFLNKIVNMNFFVQLFVHIFLFFVKYSKLNDQMMYMKIYNGHLILFMASCFFVLLFSKFKYSELIFLISLLFFLTLQFYFIRDVTWISTTIFLTALTRFDLKKCMQIIFFASVLACFFVIGLYFRRLIPEFTLVRDGSIRHSFGFSHPNFLGTMIFLIFFQYLYLFGKRKFVLDLCLFILAFFCLWNFTGSRNALVSLTIGYIVYFFSNSLFSNKVFCLLTSLSLPISFVISWIASANYSFNSYFWVFLDKALSGRIRLASIFYQESPPNLFGSKLEMITTEKAQQIIGGTTKILDNAYMSILLKYGIVICILLCILYYLGTVQIIKKKKTVLLSFILVFVIYGFSESYFTFFEINFSLILCYYYVFYNNWKMKDTKCITKKRRKHEIQ